MSKRLIFATMGALILVLIAQLALSAEQQSQTIDESVHILAGYQYWLHGDFGANPEHPPLVKWVAAWPLKLMGLKSPGVLTGPTKSAYGAASLDFLYRNIAPSDIILYRARMAVLVFPALLALFVFLAANEMFGTATAFLSLLLLIFEPNIIANGALVTTDLGETCFLFATIYTFYRLMRNPALPRAVLCGCALALALGAKHSGVLVLPMMALLTGSEVLNREGLRRLRQLAPCFAVGILIAWVGLWALYLFRGAARPEGATLNPPLDTFVRTVQSGLVREALLAARHTHILPESYLWGLTDVLIGAEGRPTFLLGKVYASGQWFYFPLVFLMKSTLTILVLLLAFPFLAARRMGRREVAFLALPVLVFFGAAMNSGMNIGLRHILPIFPFVIIMAAFAANRIALQSKAGAGIVLLLVLLHAVTSLRVFPNYLTYANELAGGSSHSRKLMTDSNVDWSQGFKQAARYASERQLRDCWVANRIPPDLLEMPCRALVSGLREGRGPVPPFPGEIEGTVFVSANEIAGQAWGPGEMNPYNQFSLKEPDEVIANTVLVFRGKFDVSLASALNYAVMARRSLVAKRPEKAWEEAARAAALGPNSAEVQATLCAIGRAINRTDVQSACDRAIAIAKAAYPEYQLTRVPAVRSLIEAPQN